MDFFQSKHFILFLLILLNIPSYSQKETKSIESFKEEVIVNREKISSIEDRLIFSSRILTWVFSAFSILVIGASTFSIINQAKNARDTARKEIEEQKENFENIINEAEIQLQSIAEFRQNWLDEDQNSGGEQNKEEDV